MLNSLKLIGQMATLNRVFFQGPKRSFLVLRRLVKVKMVHVG